MSDEIPIRKRKKRVLKGQPPSLSGPQLAVKMADNQEKRRQALILRKQGATYEQIQRAMGLSTPMVAWRYVNDAIRAIPATEAKENKALAQQKLDAQEQRVNTLLQKLEVKREQSLTGELFVLEQVRLELALTRTAERRAKLEGHDAPSRTEVTGRDGAPLALTVAQLEGMDDEQLADVIRAHRGSVGGHVHSDEAGEAPSEAGPTRRAH